MNVFELRLSLPADARFANTLAALATQAATQAGCGDADAAAFATAVEDAMLGCVRTHAEDVVAVVLKSVPGEISAELTCGTAVKVARPVLLDV